LIDFSLYLRRGQSIEGLGGWVLASSFLTERRFKGGAI
jgi:hypothetical protein